MSILWEDSENENSRLKDEFLTNLEDKIDECSSTFRKIEQALFLDDINLLEDKKAIFIIHSVAIIYAIWEGYVNYAFKKYITYLNSLNIPLKNFHNNIRVYDIEIKHKQFKNYPDDQSKKMVFYNAFESYLNNTEEKISLNINTESNVDFNVLNKLFVQFNLGKLNKFTETRKHPDLSYEEGLSKFLKHRGRIVHGNELTADETINRDILEIYIKLVMDLMSETIIKMEEGINNRSYLKK